MYNANEKVEPINVADEDHELVPRLLDVGHHLARAARRARRTEAFAAPHPLRDARPVALPEPASIASARRSAATRCGNYHPHGEAVIYPTLVHMAQPWAMRETLVDGQGNFGSVEGDPPAAMRYTEARLTHLGAALMRTWTRTRSISSRTTTRRRTEPTVFPAAFPNLLVNGGTGIAVGMATNMPPHNLGEVIDGICAQIDNPDITITELMKFIKGPDFPTGCMICGVGGHQALFRDRPRQHEGARQGRRRGAERRPRADRHHRDSVQREPRRLWSSGSPNWSTRRSSRTSPRCATSRTRTRASSSS